jgi:hypothetical protein
MSFLMLFDVRPDPVPVAGVGGLILLAFIVLMFTAALIVGFAFLLKRLKRNGRAASPIPGLPDGQPGWGGAVSEGLRQPARAGQFQPSNPNQP